MLNKTVIEIRQFKATWQRAAAKKVTQEYVIRSTFCSTHRKKIPLKHLGRKKMMRHDKHFAGCVEDLFLKILNSFA